MIRVSYSSHEQQFLVSFYGHFLIKLYNSQILQCIKGHGHEFDKFTPNSCLQYYYL